MATGSSRKSSDRASILRKRYDYNYNYSPFITEFTTKPFQTSLNHTTLAIYFKTCDDYLISINSLTGPHAPMGHGFTGKF